MEGIYFVAYVARNEDDTCAWSEPKKLPGFVFTGVEVRIME
jgi:hypothetical protein